VPTPNVSLVDLTVRVEKPSTKEAVNEAFKKAAQDPSFLGVLAVTNEPLVSIDFNGDPHSATVDLTETMVVGDLVKALAWYDNETGYATRLFDLAHFVAKKGI
jgi:glyceraldehyde 3-phosphate dehydrogenase